MSRKFTLQIGEGGSTISGTLTPHEVEVSWQELRRIVREWAGSDAELEEVAPLCGGGINTTLCLRTKDGGRCVLKITPHRVDRSYADEAHQLQILREVGVPVPDVHLCRTGSLENPFSYILMEFVEGVDLAAAKSRCTPEEFDGLQLQLADIVLRMHERRSPHYMRVTQAEPARFNDWSECYRWIFDPILQDVSRSGLLPVKARKTVGRVHDRLDRLLRHDQGPRLVHWDIWATNVLAVPDGDGRWRIAALLDPNCKYAHAEAEIAYLELFHTVTPAFLKRYQQVHRLPPEYHQIRRPVYQLYSLLNHLHLFGQEYLKAALAMIDRAAVLV